MSLGEGTNVQECKGLVCVDELEGWDVSSVEAEGDSGRSVYLMTSRVGNCRVEPT